MNLDSRNYQNLHALESHLQYTFLDKHLLIQALTHRSCKARYNNERLEFLGDAVLDLLIGEYLFKKFKNANEGDLSKLRASIVNEQGFMKLALELDLGKYIFISQSEEYNAGRTKSSILSNAFEAIIGAIYLESGITKAAEITYRVLESCYKTIDLSLTNDYKTLLQELTQSLFSEIPTYELVSESGPDHQKLFEIAIVIDNKEYARCIGSSKKNAQQKCAKIAYEILESQKARLHRLKSKEQ
ncbi:ribonuclease III [Helicobacter sp. 10-6591]|uniref:ribonuclease III n=1 Tax=Helicobacter sp. 10-6591 TaxID=2004998 RepID=UPI000DCE68B1|nr:ribonuclease III [Helicobacter sp. 10-6591]RAX55008.1 ribonuclease III [Helicobacter sp. 10-6591]